MADLTIQNGEVGTTITLDAECDISGASRYYIRYRRPDGTEGEWEGSLSGTEEVVYTTHAGDIAMICSEAGTEIWELELKVVYAAGAIYPSAVKTMEVLNSI